MDHDPLPGAQNGTETGKKADVEKGGVSKQKPQQAKSREGLAYSTGHVLTPGCGVRVCVHLKMCFINAR